MKKNKFGWEIKKFDDIFSIITDGTHQTPTYTDDKVNGFKFLSSKDVVGGSINWSKVKYIPESLHNQLYSRLAPQRNDILLAKNGTTGVCAVVDNDEVFDIYVSLALLRPLPDINVKYLAQYINSPYAKSQFNSHLKGIGVPNLHLSEIKKTKIPIPPLSIQHQIVSELDALSEIINKKKQQLEELDKLAQATFYDMFGDPVSNEKGWEKDSIGNQFKVSAGGTPKTNIEEYWTNGTISWIGSNMCKDNVLYSNDGKYITELGLSKSSAKIYEPNTVLVALVGATIGKVSLLKFPTSTNQNIAGIDINSNDLYSPEFVFYMLMNLYSLFMEIGDDKFKMANLSFVRNLPAIKPPILLQNQFAAKIELIEAQKCLINRSIVEVQQLFDYTMDKYFN